MSIPARNGDWNPEGSTDATAPQRAASRNAAKVSAASTPDAGSGKLSLRDESQFPGSVSQNTLKGDAEPLSSIGTRDTKLWLVNPFDVIGSTGSDDSRTGLRPPNKRSRTRTRHPCSGTAVASRVSKDVNRTPNAHAMGPREVAFVSAPGIGGHLTTPLYPLHIPQQSKLTAVTTISRPVTTSGRRHTRTVHFRADSQVGCATYQWWITVVSPSEPLRRWSAETGITLLGREGPRRAYESPFEDRRYHTGSTIINASYPVFLY